MRVAAIFLGWVFIFLGLCALGWELYVLADRGHFQLSPLGALWFKVHAPSLNLYQAVVERYISPVLWDKVLAPILLWPAVAVFAVPGVVLAALPWLVERLQQMGDAEQG